MEDVAPRKRRTQRSPTPPKRKILFHSPHRRELKIEENSSRKKKERKRSPSSPSSSPSSSFDKSSGYSSQEEQRRGHQRSYAAWKGSNKLKKLKERKRSPSSPSSSPSSSFDKSSGYSSQEEQRRGHQRSYAAWKGSNKLKKFKEGGTNIPFSPMMATVYKKIECEEQKQQFCAGLPKDMNEYVNSQILESALAVIHHTMVAARINFHQGAKRNLKPMETKDKQEYKEKNFSQNSSKGDSNNSKAKEKGAFKARLLVELIVLQALLLLICGLWFEPQGAISGASLAVALPTALLVYSWLHYLILMGRQQLVMISGKQINNLNEGQADLDSNISIKASVNQKLNLPLETIVEDSHLDSSSELSYFEMTSSSTKVNFDLGPSNKGESSEDGMERYCVKVEDRRGDMKDLVPVIYSGDRYFDDQGFMYIVVLNPSIVDKWGMMGTKEKVDVEPEEAPPALDKPNLNLRRINDMTRVNIDNIFLRLYKYDGGEHAITDVKNLF
ncbi:hypothetical protein L7F22_042635 [Adiantum nelumboides]|nr:hypothetical protein [Adiantum nelumboides]